MDGLATILARGVRRRCPACGGTPIFERWNELRESCGRCGCAIRAREADTWIFMYVSLAAITGVFLAVMFLMPPADEKRWRFLLTAAAAIAYAGTIWVRKGLAIAILYYIDRRFTAS